MRNILDGITSAVGSYLPNVLGAVIILVVGWLVSLAIAAGVRAALRRTSLDERLGGWVSGKQDGTRWDESISRVVFYVLMLFVLVGCFQALKLTLITGPLSNLLDRVFTFLPQLFGAIALLLVAWALASLLRLVISRALQSSGLDSRLGQQVAAKEEPASVPVSRSLADAVYWLVFLLFLPAVLGVLGLSGLLGPVQELTDQLLGFLPRILGAVVILAVGWFVARIVQRVVVSLLGAVGLDQLSERIGLSAVLGKQRLSGVIGLIVYALILIPVLIASLNALSLEAVTQPASEMLNTILAAVPSIFGALMVVAIAYVIGKVVSALVSNLLAGIGFNTVLVKLGLGSGPEKDRTTPSEIVGYIVIVAIMLFAATEAFSMLGFDALSELVAQFTVFGGRILMGLVIFAIGLLLARLVARTVRSSGTPHSAFLALTARIAVLVLTGAIALRQMGLADDIINLAFGLLLGAVAIAAAIAFGIGGRPFAQNILEGWRGSFADPDRGREEQR